MPPDTTPTNQPESTQPNNEPSPTPQTQATAGATPTFPSESTLSKTLGIIGLVCAFLLPLIGFGISLAALIISKKEGRKNVPALIGIIASTILMVIGVVLIVMAFVVGSGVNDTLFTDLQPLPQESVEAPATTNQENTATTESQNTTSTALTEAEKQKLDDNVTYLAEQIQAYQNRENTYPNSLDLLTKNKNFNAALLSDGNNYVLAVAPQGCTTNCTGYRISLTLSDGTVYQRYSSLDMRL